MLDKVQAQIKDLAGENPTSKAVFEALGRRTRARNITNLNWFKYFLTNGGTQVASDEYIEVFKKLQAMGVGTLVRGQKTKSGAITPARFEWNYNLKDVARAATGSLNNNSLRKVDSNLEVKKSKLEAKLSEIKPVSPVKTEQKAVSNSIAINKGGVNINIELPKDIRPEDLTAWLSLVRDIQK